MKDAFKKENIRPVPTKDRDIGPNLLLIVSNLPPAFTMLS